MKKSIGKDALTLTSSRIIGLGLSMMTVMVLARTITLKEYGTYSQIMIIMNIIASIFTLGFPSSINYFLAGEENENYRTKFISVYYSFSTIMSIIAGVLLVINSKNISVFYNNSELLNFRHIFLLYPWVVIIKNSIANILIVHSRTRQLLKFNLLHSTTIFVLVIVSNYFKLSLETFMMLLLIDELIFVIAIYVIIKQLTVCFKFIIDWDLLKNIFKYALPIGFASIIGTLGIQLDKMIIGRLFDTEFLAIYTNASKELPVTFIASSITAVLIPHVVKKLKDGKVGDAVSLWKEASYVSFIFISFFSVSLIVFAPEVITILYSSKYIPGVTVFRIYNIVLLLRFTYFGLILNASGKTKLIMYSSLASLILNLLLSIFMYRMIGYTGPAIATLVSMLIVAGFQLISSCNVISVKLREILPWVRMLRVLIFNVAIGLIISRIKSFILLDLIVGEVFESVILGTIWILGYGIIMKKSIFVTWKVLNNDKSD